MNNSDFKNWMDQTSTLAEIFFRRIEEDTPTKIKADEIAGILNNIKAQFEKLHYYSGKDRDVGINAVNALFNTLSKYIPHEIASDKGVQQAYIALDLNLRG